MISQRETRLQHFYYRRKSSPAIVREGDHLLRANGHVVSIVQFADDSDDYCLVEGAGSKREWVRLKTLLLPWGVRAAAAINSSRKSDILHRKFMAGLIHD